MERWTATKCREVAVEICNQGKYVTRENWVGRKRMKREFQDVEAMSRIFESLNVLVRRIVLLRHHPVRNIDGLHFASGQRRQPQRTTQSFICGQDLRSRFVPWLLQKLHLHQQRAASLGYQNWSADCRTKLHRPLTSQRSRA